jgi:DNA-binding HxlR family transcriptional regulator
MRCTRRDPVPEEVRRAADLLERRWTLSILYASVDGAIRFNEFRQALGQRVPPATLTARLSGLVDAGVLERRVLDTRPPAVEYRLTKQGKRFAPLLRELARCARLGRAE